MPQNSAAWLTARSARLEVGPAPDPSPGEGELVVRVRAVAVNPLDAMVQSLGAYMYRWLDHPAVLGEDIAGEVVAVGPGVSRFRAGDRVLAYAVGLEKSRNRAAEGGFQLLAVVRELLTSPIPDDLAFEEAAVLPLGISTAASALFQKDQLALRHPATAAGPAGETLLVWGGSTSVGANAIQLAVAAGYDVISTASPRNHEFVRGLGARLVVDYRSPTAVRELGDDLRGRRSAGALAVGAGSAEACVAILAASSGRKRLVMATPTVSFEPLAFRGGLDLTAVRVLGRLVASNVALQVRSRARGVRAGYVWGSSLMENEVAPLIFERFLPGALREGRYRAAPAPHVAGSGLASIQPALDTLRAGVSARKLVVTL